MRGTAAAWLVGHADNSVTLSRTTYLTAGVGASVPGQVLEFAAGLMGPVCHRFYKLPSERAGLRLCSRTKSGTAA